MNSGRYGQHNLKIIGLILGAMVIISTFVILLSGDRYEDYLGLGEYPNCMKVDEYGMQEMMRDVYVIQER